MRNQLWSVPPFRKMPDRRIRKARFKDRDLRVLIDSVMERRGDIFGEGGQPPTMQSRRQAWLFVMEKVNAVSGTRRTWEEVRKKVHDLKKSTKEKLAYNRRARQLSCGARPDIKTLTEFENDMILLFGKESFEGLDTADLGVLSRLSDQGETSGSSTTAAKQHHTPKYQISSPQAEAGTSIDTPTGGGGSVEDEEELAQKQAIQPNWTMLLFLLHKNLLPPCFISMNQIGTNESEWIVLVSEGGAGAPPAGHDSQCRNRRRLMQVVWTVKRK
ncbi:nuclear apoptosis-inducing factor 1 isoform X2 [Carcharodon carcharias]|uniref:nuclear apoptosis-inducing factor 1 isoform X2 n=1 Tax=Carcharodon carcharias TaxID=13397 RepID=UPI001B7EB902|nr:nuclear apoptosis-inducing factor 1 isoform X2 [Carcharodon carcharias]